MRYTPLEESAEKLSFRLDKEGRRGGAAWARHVGQRICLVRGDK